MRSGNRIKKNPYLYFTVKLLLLLFIVFLFDFTIGKTLSYFYFKQECGRQYRATYAIEKTTADILIFGSSRAYHQYVPGIIEDRLKQSCYNTGSPGQFLLYNYATLKAILKRYSPKLIILDVSPGDLRVEKESYERLSFLLPYYKKHEEIRPIVDLKSPLEKFKLLSSIYAFNSSFLMIAGGNSEYFKKKTTDIKGYKPLTGIWNGPIETGNSEAYKIDSTKANIFTDFIKDCHSAKTELFIVCSPSYVKYSHREYSISIIEKIAKEQNTAFIDFTNNAFFTNRPDLFDDPGHLNDNGAKIFSNKLIDTLGRFFSRYASVNPVGTTTLRNLSKKDRGS